MATSISFNSLKSKALDNQRDSLYMDMYRLLVRNDMLLSKITTLVKDPDSIDTITKQFIDCVDVREIRILVELAGRLAPSWLKSEKFVVDYDDKDEWRIYKKDKDTD